MSHITPVLQYGDEWKLHRKLLHLSLRHEAVDRYQDLHLSNAHRLLENMRHDSENFCEHFDQYVLRFSFGIFFKISSYTGSTALEFTYGRKVNGKDDPIITMASSLAEIMAKGMTSERMGLLMALPIR